MKVKELIQELSQFNPEAIILNDIDNSDSNVETLITWSYKNEKKKSIYFDSNKCKSKAKEISIKFENI